MRLGVLASVASSDIDEDSTAVWPAPPSRTVLAWRDIREGWSKRWLWKALALQDIKLRYRGSLLGPFWVTISTLAMVVAMGVIYPLLFHIAARQYIPYLAIGLIVWQTLATIVNEGCETFLREESVIQQVPIPFSVHAYRCVCRNFIVLAHNLAIVPLGILVLGMPLDWRVIEIVPAFVVIAINGVWISILLGMVSARFRDVPPIVASFMQVLFFLTPIMWPMEALGDWQRVVRLNPFFAALDLVRAPLLGVPPAPTSWLVLLVTTAIGLIVGFLMF